jgi:hypothetical protein
MPSGPMNEPGQAQLLLIRRYARAMRELRSEAIKARAPRTGAGEQRPAVPPESLIAAAQSLAADPPPPTTSA